jgi:hypothetical protein
MVPPKYYMDILNHETPALPRSTAIVRQMVAVRFFIREV